MDNHRLVFRQRLLILQEPCCNRRLRAHVDNEQQPIPKIVLLFGDVVAPSPIRIFFEWCGDAGVVHGLDSTENFKAGDNLGHGLECGLGQGYELCPEPVEGRIVHPSAEAEEGERHRGADGVKDRTDGVLPSASP